MATMPGFVPGRYIILTVSDDGMGMSQQVQARVFEPFFTTKPLGKGTGLGLAMVYGIVKQSGGYIRIDSELDRGTTVQIFFPAVDEAVSAVEIDTIAPVRGQGETILLAEDEDALRESIAAYLKKHGYAGAGSFERRRGVAGRRAAPGTDSPAADRCGDAQDGRRRTGARAGEASA